MKKIICLVLLCCLFLTGCGNYTEKNIIDSVENKLNKGNGYKLSGDLSVNNNDENYNYDIEVSYKKKDYYKVVLTNKQNDHTQIILKNNDGVYVLTPLLNKSFRFQSDWPYNNSQIYLINSLINDIKNDKERKFVKKDNQYIFNTRVKYPNNSKLVNQKIIMSDNLKLEKVIVYDKNGVTAMTMNFDKIDYSPNFKKDEFNLDSIVKDDKSEALESASLDDIIYPLYIPSGTKLVNEDKVKKQNGERVIMNYDGDKSFVLVEETADVFNEFTVIPTMGEPYLVMDTFGVATDNSLSWVSSGIEYYLISDVMSKDEMMEVAQSISGIVSMK
ncbi:MAG: hypothetical protein IJ097_00915 [Bacilli bacterium]|nr:hypothetical protein [Bacilli bacterium]